MVSFVVGWLTVCPAYALQVTKLYEVSIHVDTQDASERKAALQEGIQQVLIKVSGHASTLQDSYIQNQIRIVNNYIKSYRYRKDKRSGGFWLDVDFAKHKINTLLNKQKKPLWGSSRPVTLVWLANNKQPTASIVYADDGDIKPDVLNAMDERGLPVRFPQPRHSLTPEQITQQAMLAVKEKSKAYQADAVVVGTLQEKHSQWRFYGRFLTMQKQFNMHFSADSKQALMRRLAAFLGEKLANQYAVVLPTAMQQSHYQLSVKGISDFQTYYGLLTYLRSKTGIEQVLPSKVQGSTLVLTLKLSLPWSQVIPVLRAEQKLLVDRQDKQFWRWYP